MKTKYFVQIIGTRAALYAGFIKELGCRVQIITKPQEISKKADICLALGVHYLIKTKYLYVPRLGIWGAHESLLPIGKGFAPIHWTVLGKQKKLTVSFFQLIEKMDSGDLLGQESCPILKTALLEDMREMALALTKRLLKENLISFLRGKKVPYCQKGKSSYYRRRGPEDARLDVKKRLIDLWDLIRVCDNEKYPAWFMVGKEKFILKRYKVKSLDETGKTRFRKM